jgi:hypothetical protein
VSVPALITALFGSFVALLGLAGITSPARLLDLVARAQSQLGLGLIAALRIAVGLAMLLAAAESRAPLYLQVLGALALLSGIATPLFGLRRFEALLAWWRARTPGFVRVFSVVVLLLGGSLVWAVAPR